ncbi:hypothetical protein OPQ81_001998 [Rhizoctonia solani]|nr:hypothetical protein OPQ81_001998 [Rhizoctonia solani]
MPARGRRGTPPTTITHNAGALRTPSVTPAANPCAARRARTAASLGGSLPHQLVLLGSLLCPPQLPHPLVTRVAVDDVSAVDERLGPARIPALLDLALSRSRSMLCKSRERGQESRRIKTCPKPVRPELEGTK